MRLKVTDTMNKGDGYKHEPRVSDWVQGQLLEGPRSGPGSTAATLLDQIERLAEFCGWLAERAVIGGQISREQLVERFDAAGAGAEAQDHQENSDA